MSSPTLAIGYSVHVRTGGSWATVATRRKALTLSCACDLATELRQRPDIAEVRVIRNRDAA